MARSRAERILASAAAMTTPMAGRAKSRDSSFILKSMKTLVSSVACAVAVRGISSRRAISPKNSPGCTWAMTELFWVTGSRRDRAILPEKTMKSARPMSPWAKRVSPFR